MAQIFFLLFLKIDFIFANSAEDTDHHCLLKLQPTNIQNEND